MLVPKKLLEQLTKFALMKDPYAEYFKTLYLIEEASFLFALDGRNFVSLALDGKQIPTNIDANTIRAISFEELKKAMPLCGDVIDLEQLQITKPNPFFKDFIIDYINAWLKRNSKANIPRLTKIDYRSMEVCLNVLKIAFHPTKKDNPIIKFGFIKPNALTLEANTKEVALYCLIGRMVDYKDIH